MFAASRYPVSMVTNELTVIEQGYASFKRLVEADSSLQPAEKSSWIGKVCTLLRSLTAYLAGAPYHIRFTFRSLSLSLAE